MTRFFTAFLLITLFLPARAPAADETRAQKERLAGRYYRECIRQEEPEKDILVPELRQSVCSCTAAAMAAQMSLQELQTVFKTGEESRSLRDIITVESYAPCSAHVVANLVFDQCLKNPVVMAELNHPWHVCKCTGRKMEEFTKEKAPDFYVNLLTMDTGLLAYNQELKTTDPLTLYALSPLFARTTEGYLQGCIQEYEYGFR